MKLEKGMYVRTKNGKIKKLLKYTIDENVDYINNHRLYFEGDDFGSLYKKEELPKGSYNIIDLIEPLDLLFIDISPDDYGGIVVPRIAETLRELETYKEMIKSGEYILKGVLTKEQIQANIYKLDDSHA